MEAQEETTAWLGFRREKATLLKRRTLTLLTTWFPLKNAPVLASCLLSKQFSRVCILLVLFNHTGPFHWPKSLVCPPIKISYTIILVKPHNSSAYVLRSFLMSSRIWLQHIHNAFHKRESHTNPLENELPGRYNCDRGIYLCVSNSLN